MAKSTRPGRTMSFGPLSLLGITAMLIMLAVTPAQAAAPSNDDIDDAIAVSGIPFTDRQNTSDATSAEGDSCGVATVWYVFTPADSGSYQFATAGSDYDTTLAVYEGSPGDLGLLECNDDRRGLQAAIRRQLTAGTNYYVEAGTCCGVEPGQVGPGGALVFTIDVSPPDVELSLTVDSAKVGSAKGTADVSGTIRCTTDASVYFSGVVEQQQGLEIVRGNLGGYLDGCPSTPTSWSVTTFPAGRVFLPKSATVTLIAEASDGFTSDFEEVTKAIRLKKK